MANGWNVHFLSSAKGVGTRLDILLHRYNGERGTSRDGSAKKNAPFSGRFA